MIREQYLRQLWELLTPIPERLRRDLMFDYEEHFRQAAEHGKSEEEAAHELGDPRMIAKEMLLGYRVEQAEIRNGGITHVSRAVFAAVSLGFFNLVFVLGPFIGLLGILLALWATSIAVGLSSLAAIYEGVFGDAWSSTQGIFVAIALLAVGMLLGALSHWLTRAVSRVTLKYLKFNFRMMRVKKQ
ncbi:HAAS signaling domain-containing protein [Paenibacillus nasutitermitis]|uniref:DUF1700 domain-containing protein n=1 Tax=Paenibacillus nasutitermitis TaxID=1652958 RepID=A0A916ZCG9_9BACL|nr:DUF1700 domain-containing protein [Paenibacillus nasutitermitis]GGD86523.1 hypothetical protein GCM10010911_51250 [Paenibacillus nasutitermitis]